MKSIFNLVEKIFFTKIIGEINLYMILSTVIKYVFVFIVLYFIYAIVKMIFYDINIMYNEENIIKSYIISKSDKDDDKNSEKYILENVNTVGRGLDNSIILKENYISNRHSAIIKRDDGFYLEDLESSNGTFLNGDKLLEAKKIDDGDKISFGNKDFLFVEGEDI